MTASRNAARAYAVAATRRSLREQEADVFRHANAVLRRARDTGEPARARALADNDRLWTLVLDLVRDPENALPGPLRAAIASVGLVVQRELRGSSPDIDFVLSINDSIARGLAGAA